MVTSEHELPVGNQLASTQSTQTKSKKIIAEKKQVSVAFAVHRFIHKIKGVLVGRIRFAQSPSRNDCIYDRFSLLFSLAACLLTPA